MINLYPLVVTDNPLHYKSSLIKVGSYEEPLRNRLHIELQFSIDKSINKLNNFQQILSQKTDLRERDLNYKFTTSGD